MEKYNKTLNYCTFSPEEIFGVKFNYGCYLHDKQYRNQAKIRKTRKNADILLRNIIQKEFTKKDKSIQGFFVSWIYYFGVRWFASFAWKP